MSVLLSADNFSPKFSRLSRAASGLFLAAVCPLYSRRGQALVFVSLHIVLNTLLRFASCHVDCRCQLLMSTALCTCFASGALSHQWLHHASLYMLRNICLPVRVRGEIFLYCPCSGQTETVNDVLFSTEVLYLACCHLLINVICHKAPKRPHQKLIAKSVD